MEAAAALIGAPFRLHGRDPKFGLDCIGLVFSALQNSGRFAVAPRGYRLRNTSIDQWLGYAENSGFQECGEDLASGDIILVEPGPGQHHLLICEREASFIHAHAGIGKVCRMSAPLSWPVVKHWRLTLTS
ncbi:NlpC/P60 family protein [Erythrobacter sp. HA6-11]